MLWTVILTPEFADWFLAEPEAARDRINASPRLIRDFGPALGRLHVDPLENSTAANPKELRIPVGGLPYRVFFAFDTARRAVLLRGGDRTGDQRFYRRMIPVAEAAFERHAERLKKLQDEGRA